MSMPAVADGLDALADLVHQARVRAAHGGDDAELRGAGGRRLPGGLDQAGDVQPRGAHRRLEPAGLGAEVAVLGAAAGLEADDALDLDLRAAPAHRGPRGRAASSRPAGRRRAAAPGGLLLGQADAPLAAPGRGPPRARPWRAVLGHRISFASDRYDQVVPTGLVQCGVACGEDVGIEVAVQPRRQRVARPRPGTLAATGRRCRPAARRAAARRRRRAGRRGCTGGQVGFGRPAADDHADALDAPRTQRLGGQRGGVQRAEAGVCDEQRPARRAPTPTSASVPPASSNRTSRPPAPSISTRSCSAASSPAAAATSAGVHRRAGRRGARRLPGTSGSG